MNSSESSDQELLYNDQLDCAQRSMANLRKDIRIIVRDELQYLLSRLIDKQHSPYLGVEEFN